MNELCFNTAFRALTGNDPFPWQCDLYENWFSKGKFPDACTLPTGLGKTSVIAVWLIALANSKPVPRRLVYVVNRRTVVDQTTDEVEKYRKNLAAAGITEPLAISTLRGQFADNREWSADPSRPAVICGTVDMIGSRLLFSGYGVGFKGKPLHAGFLGQDAIQIHDEAHLEPAFQNLLISIQKEQQRCKDFRPLKVMELTATSHGTSEVFTLSDNDKAVEEVKKRIHAKKAITLVPNKDEKKLAEEIAELALKHKDAATAPDVLVFVRKVDDVDRVVKKLPKNSFEQLTGTLRGLERDELVKKPIFQRFLPQSNRDEAIELAQGTVYLVCTSAGEVGVNISADHLVCDLSTFESMAQRFGRVNRFGKRTDTEIHVVHPTAFEDDDYDRRREKTLALLRELNGNASPDALGNIDPVMRQAAFAPQPTILPTSDILFDAWALTTIKGKLPGRPMVEPYLHGISGWEPPETHVAWREEVDVITGDLLMQYKPADLLEDYPLKPHEQLRDNSSRVFDRLKKLKADEQTPVWIVADDDSVRVTTLGKLIEDGKEVIERKTVLLPPSTGGLENGMLTSDSDTADDVSDYVRDEKGRQRRLRVWDDAPIPNPDEMRRIRAAIDTKPDADDDEAQTGKRFWHWYELLMAGDSDGSKSNKDPVLWHIHVKDVVDQASSIVAKLPLDQKLKEAIIVAAQLHDHGKRRRQFQLVLNNFDYPKVILAKSGKKGGRITESYRHEFGSLLEAASQPEFATVTDPDMRDLVLHLIATHHGRGRPHFPQGDDFDPEPPPGSNPSDMAMSVPRRFACLQRKFGRWGLAYLESLLRVADWAASGNPSEFWKGEQS